ncbi:MAG: hybrid sensor histidine kinase/response regulator [Candidatus Omnitrophica bacterium]|nr:hybrid sensor histidine kinase/response regulator [Candidatus Omnitrophota bacterium]MBI2173893.1 hybrid sensor histidine kinase/response regulator [Candidatus Omnitrophota bacterium]MBI3010016.1 hybrid sensor histidine kinase/response regulator [Candidatus Omnitrophota bacterium]
MNDSLDVLVVDDEPKICQVLEQILTARGCRVRVAKDGLEGLGFFQQQAAEVVITDIKMPKLNGLELMRELKRLDPLLNIVVITAYPSIEGAVDAMKHGACDFITKPFEISQVQAILYRCQQRLSLSKQLRAQGEELVKLEELNRRLAELNDMKSQFLAALSHEVNTPLCLMSEWIYLLSDGTLGRLSNDQEHAVDVLIAAYERLHRLLRQLIDLMQGHTIVLHRQAIGVQEIVQQAIAAVTPKALGRSIVITTNLPEPPFMVEVDRNRCVAAVEYILDNAIKFSHEKGSIYVDIADTAEAVTVRIRDSGIGIPEEEQDKVFSAFYQVDRRLNREFEGAGIGLALAKRYMELHGGSVRLSSAVDVGTTVTLSFPHVTTSVTPPPASETPL